MKKLLQSQYERVFPMLVAKSLLDRSSNTHVYHTRCLPYVWGRSQLEALFDLQKKKLIEVPDLYEAKKGKDDVFQKKWTTEIRLRNEFVPEEGGRTFSVSVSESLAEYYSQDATYDEFKLGGEMGVKKMSEWLLKFCEGKASRLGRENEIHIFDAEMTNDEVNPFLAALYLGMKGNLQIISMSPPRRIDDAKEIILELDIISAVHFIRTSRLEYDLNTGDGTLLGTDRKIHLDIGDQPDLILRAMHKSKMGFLTKKELIDAAKSKSNQTEDDSAKALIHTLRSNLGIQKPKNKEDIIRTIVGVGYGLIP